MVKIRVDAVILVPNDGAGLPQNALYQDSGSSTLTQVGPGNVPAPISGGGSSLFQKLRQSGFSGVLPAGTPFEFLPDGRITKTSSASSGEPVGVTLDELAAIDAIGMVQHFGPVADGVVTGLGFVPGDEVFVSQAAGGYTNDATSIPSGDAIVRLGIAACPGGAASAVATDIIALLEIN